MVVTELKYHLNKNKREQEIGKFELKKQCEQEQQNNDKGDDAIFMMKKTTEYNTMRCLRI